MSSNVNAGVSSRIEQFRESLFAVGLVGGMLIFALGFGFTILGISLTTNPPAPYFPNMTHKLLTTGIGVGGMVLGLGVVKGAFKVGGW